MKLDPSSQSLGERITLTLIIVVVVILLLAFIGWATGRWEASAEQMYTPGPYEERLLELEREAMAEGFKQHMIKLFQVWVTDAYQPGVPPKAAKGAATARDAYTRAMEAIAARERRMRNE